MVILPSFNRRRGALATECIIALSILSAVMLPVAFSFRHEARMLRAYYQRAIAMEIVDGEMERIMAAVRTGGGRGLRLGRQPYASRAVALTNLPPGELVLTRSESSVRLEWIPGERNAGGGVVREVKFQ